MASTFDPERFREAVLYVAWRTHGDNRFGRVKLAKTLFYADFEAYADDGMAVTGARYEHWPFGPFPPALYDMEDELERRGEAKLRRPEFEGDEAKLIALHEPKTPHLEAWHRALLDMKIKELGGLSSTRVSDESHEHPGWIATRDREEIPYAAALLPTKPSRGALELAHRRFRGQGRNR